MSTNLSISSSQRLLKVKFNIMSAPCSDRNPWNISWKLKHPKPPQGPRRRHSNSRKLKITVFRSSKSLVAVNKFHTRPKRTIMITPHATTLTGSPPHKVATDSQMTNKWSVGPRCITFKLCSPLLSKTPILSAPMRYAISTTFMMTSLLEKSQARELHWILIIRPGPLSLTFTVVSSSKIPPP